MKNYSRHELDAKRHAFMKRKMHQFPELRNERYYIEPVESVKPIEKYHTAKRSQLFPTMRLSSQY